MILLDTIIRTAINPALALLPPHMDTPAARVEMLAIGLQESGFMNRYQLEPHHMKGPARGFWEMERGGGVHGVMSHPASQDQAERVCIARAVPFDSVLIHARLETDDILAAAFARLLLWTDRDPLPGVDCAHEDAWRYYVSNWRPGHPRRETWDAYHTQARAQVVAPIAYQPGVK